MISHFGLKLTIISFILCLWTLVVDPSVDDFFSIIREQNDGKRHSQESQSAQEAASLERQAEILKDDDIADFDSDDE